MSDKTASEISFAAWIDSAEPAAVLARALIDSCLHNQYEARIVIEFVYRSAHITGRESAALQLSREWQESVAKAFDGRPGQPAPELKRDAEFSNLVARAQ